MRLVNASGVALSYSGEKLDRNEIKEYIESGTEAGVLSTQIADNLRAMLQGTQDDDAKRMSIELGMSLPPKELADAVAAAEKAENDQPDNDNIDTLRDAALAAQWSVMPRNEFNKRAIAIAKEMGPQHKGVANMVDLRIDTSNTRTIAKKMRKQFSKTTNKTLPSRALEEEFRALAWMVRRSRQFSDGIRKLRDLSLMDPKADNFANKAHDKLEDIAKDFEPWVHMNMFELVWNKKIPFRNLALVKALASITDQKEPLVGVVTSVDENDEMITDLIA